MSSGTGNGKSRVIFLTGEIEKALAVETIKQGKSLSRIVREAVIPYLMLRGYTFSDAANPEGPGARTDLRKRTGDTLNQHRSRRVVNITDSQKKNSANLPK